MTKTIHGKEPDYGRMIEVWLPSGCRVRGAAGRQIIVEVTAPSLLIENYLALHRAHVELADLTSEIPQSGLGVSS